MTDLAIRVNNIGKQYFLGNYITGYTTLRESVRDWFSANRHSNGNSSQTENSIWAVRNMTFDVERGKAIGIIGKNGSGKSTTLKILSRVTDPTEGTAEIHGRVGSLLEVGTGFHPELTGRENVFLNGAILGMHRSEIARKMDEIIDFAGVEKFMDTPIKRYSSGMQMRLAFAVAANLEPEILVVDEVLAVGDAEFQRKCLGKMSDVTKQGRTVLFVSHNMSAILRLTEETLVIDKGHLMLRAPTPQAVDYYMSQGLSTEGERKWNADEIPANAHPFRPIALRVLNSQGKVADTLHTVDPLSFEIEYELKEPVKGLRVGIYLMSARGEYIFTSFDTDEPDRYDQFSVRPAGHYVSRCVLPADYLNEGQFLIGMNVSAFRIKQYFHDEQALVLTMDSTGAPGMHWVEPRLGPVRPRLEWTIKTV